MAAPKKLTLPYLKKLIDAISVGGATWGTITGTLSAQTDLATALSNAETNANAYTDTEIATLSGSVSSALAGKVPTTRAINTSSPISGGGDLSADRTISLASGYGDTQNPYASKTANYFLAAPNGAGGVPSFRAIVAADIPTLNQNTTGSAGTLSPGKKIGGTLFTGAADITVNPMLNILSDLGSDIKTVLWNNAWGNSNGNISLTNQVIYFQAFQVHEDCTLDGIGFVIGVTGVYVANNNNKIGVYSISGTTMTKIAECANDGNLWQPATVGYKEKDFSTPVALTAGETYFFAALFCRSSVTTNPQIAVSLPTLSNVQMSYLDLPSGKRFSAQYAAQTDLPASLDTSVLANGQTPPFFVGYANP